MIEKAFIDSNLLLYAFSRDAADREKSDTARSLLALIQPILSIQVLQETINTALRKKDLQITEPRIDLILAYLADLSWQPLTHALIVHATHLRRRYQISHWDSTILAAAHASGAATLYTEDLQHGFQLDHLTVKNPFLSE